MGKRGGCGGMLVVLSAMLFVIGVLGGGSLPVWLRMVLGIGAIGVLVFGTLFGDRFDFPDIFD